MQSLTEQIYKNKFFYSLESELENEEEPFEEEEQDFEEEPFEEEEQDFEEEPFEEEEIW